MDTLNHFKSDIIKCMCYWQNDKNISFSNETKITYNNLFDHKLM